MKKEKMIRNIFLYLILQATTLGLSAQIGIHTEKPLAIFHADPISNTYAAIPATYADDVIFKDSKLGLGTLNPDRTVDLKTSFRYQDGNQLKDRVMYVDSNHDIRWEDERPFYPPRVSVDPTLMDAQLTSFAGPVVGSPPVGINNYKYSGVSITLQRGVWLIYLKTIFFTPWGPAISGNIRALLCTSPTGTGLNSMVGAITSSASTNQGSGYFSGYVFLSNFSASQTYYLWFGYLSGNASAASFQYRSADALGVNSFYAIRYSTF